MKSLLGYLLVFVLASSVNAATYFVRPGGSDSHSCAQAQTDNDASAKATIQTSTASGTTCLNSGDTLVVHGGIYHEAIVSYVFSGSDGHGLPSGSSWANPTVIKAAPGETVILDGQRDGAVVYFAPTNSGCPSSLCDVSYLVIDGFVFDARNATSLSGAVAIGQNHIQFSNNELKNAYSNGIIVGTSTGTADDIKIINNHLHDGGLCFNTDPSCAGIPDHGIYFGGTNSLIQGNLIHDWTGWGMQIFEQNYPYPHDNLVRGNTVYNFGKQQVRASTGIGLYRDANNVAYDNTVYGGIAPGSIGIAVSLCINGCPGAIVSGNTVYKNPIGISIGPTAIGVQVKSNTLSDNGQDIENLGTGTVLENNGSPFPTAPLAPSSLIAM